MYRTHLIPLQRPDAVDVEHLHDLLLHLSRETHRVEEVVYRAGRTAARPEAAASTAIIRNAVVDATDLWTICSSTIFGRSPRTCTRFAFFTNFSGRCMDASADVLRHALQARERHVRGTDRALFHDDLRVGPYKKSSSVS